MEVPKNPLGIARTTNEANNAHVALAAGYCDWSDTRRAGRPSRFGGFGAWAMGPCPHGPGTYNGPRDSRLMASPCRISRMRLSSCRPPPGTPKTLRGGGRGGLMVADPESGWRQSYAIPVAVHVDGSYQAELCVAWEVLRTRGANRVVRGIRATQWSFHDSKGYIDVVQSRNHDSSLLSDDLLRACRGLLGMGFDAP